MYFRSIFGILLLLSTATTAFCQGNYIYDFQGRLTNDPKEGIIHIDWNNNNQIVRLTRADTCHTPDLEFAYDVQGNRIMKLIKPRNGSGLEPESSWKYTYYCYDPKGNCIAIHEREYQASSVHSYQETYRHTEQNLFTESRFGLEKIDQLQFTQTFDATIGNDGRLENMSNRSSLVPATTTTKKGRRGHKMYEANNHLSNTLVVVSDRKEEARAALQSATDYYPFGMTLADRNHEPQHRYGMNGQERAPEVAADHYTARYWEYNSRLGRRWNTDPVVVPAISPYATFENNPVRYTDKLGDKITGDMDRYYSVKMDIYNELKNHYQNLINTIGEKTKNEESWIRIDFLNERIAEGNAALRELKILEESTQEYHITYEQTDDPTYYGQNKFNTNTHAIDVILKTDAQGKLTSPFANGTLIHELKHAYQFETGELIYLYANDGGSFLKDDLDEPEAHGRSLVVGYESAEDRARAGKYITDKQYYQYYKLNKDEPRQNLSSRLSGSNGKPSNVTWGNYLVDMMYSQVKANTPPLMVFIGWEQYYHAGKRNDPHPLREEALRRLEQYRKENQK